MPRKRRPNAFFRFVVHPGTRKQPFLRPGAEFGVNLMVVLLKKYFQKNKKVKGLTREKLRADLADIVKKSAFAAVGSAQKKAPVDTGRLRQSINAQQRTPFFWTIGTNVKYARWVEEGTNPHVIRARKARALAFYWDKLPNRPRRRRRK